MPTFRRGDVVKLPIPSVIRTAKIATIESADATKLGKISAKALKQVSSEIGRLVELDQAGASFRKPLAPFRPCRSLWRK